MAFDRDFDGIVVGGGHQGLVLAAYMVKAGYDVLVLERDVDVGGGVDTTDVTSSGYRYNLHSKAHYNLSGTPWYDDLRLREHGVEYVEPENEMAMPRIDDPPIVISNDTDRTTEIIARESERDAQQFAEMRQTAEEIMNKIYLPQRFDEPLPEQEYRSLLESSELGRTYLDWTTESSFQLMSEWYESHVMQAFLLHKLTLFGEPGEGLDAPSRLGSIARCFSGEHGYEFAKGGAKMLANGLVQVIQQNGGTILTNSHVERIEVEDGRAVGVTLGNGHTYGASAFVASNLNPDLTFKELVGPAHLEEEYAAEVDGFEFNEWSVLETHLALDEPPDYVGADDVPEVNDSLYRFVGIESLTDLEEVGEAVMANEIPQGGFLETAQSIFDDTQTPPGKHKAVAERSAPYDLHGDPENWKDAKEEAEQAVLDTWREYAPNVTRDNINATHTVTPRQIRARNPNMHRGGILIGKMSNDQVLDDHFGYRTPIENLYMASSACHPGGGVNGGAGYVAAKVIHQDLGTEPWWDPVDARDALEALE